MKKLIVAAALIACAVSAQASKVTWGASAALDATKISSGTMYLMFASDAEKIDFTKLNGQTAFSLDMIKAAGFDGTLDSFAYSSSTLKKSGSTFNPTSTGYAGGTYNCYMFLLSDATGAEYMAYGGPVSVTLNAATSPTQTKTLSSFTYVQASQTPEPTSAMLLLLGFAGLALRRRRA